MEEGSLLALGNLLLDMVAPVEKCLLEQYGIEPDSIQKFEENHSGVFEMVMRNEGVTVAPGGSALNTIRMAQRLLKSPKNVIGLIGAVGADETGKLLVNTVEREGIRLLPQIVRGAATGRCVSLVSGGGVSRAMVTELGASLQFEHDRFMTDEVSLGWVGKAKVLYVSGYFVAVSPSTVMEVVQRVKTRNVPVVLNLNAVWVTTSCGAELEELLRHVNVIIGNESEVRSFGEQLQSFLNSEQESILEIAEKLSTWSVQLCRIVIVTRGADPVVLVERGTATEFPVKEGVDVVDSTGAGDAFVGGFLSGYIQGNSMERCMRAAVWAAAEELKGYGFVLPAEEELDNIS